MSIADELRRDLRFQQEYQAGMRKLADLGDWVKYPMLIGAAAGGAGGLIGNYAYRHYTDPSDVDMDILDNLALEEESRRNERDLRRLGKKLNKPVTEQRPLRGLA
jgi:hypothetical protein